MGPQIESLDHLVLTVADIARSVDFYSGCLGMKPDAFEVADGTKRWALIFGMQKINLHLAGREFEPKARKPVPGSADLCFMSATPLSDWQVHLKAIGLPVEKGPVSRTGANGPIRSIYLRDPDGNLIEVSNRA